MVSRSACHACNQVLCLIPNAPFISFLFFIISFLKKSSQIPRITCLPDCSMLQHLLTFSPSHLPTPSPNPKGPPQPPSETDHRGAASPQPPDCRHRRRSPPQPKIRSKQISNLYVPHSLILSLPLFFLIISIFNGFN